MEIGAVVHAPRLAFAKGAALSMRSLRLCGPDATPASVVHCLAAFLVPGYNSSGHVVVVLPTWLQRRRTKLEGAGTARVGERVPLVSVDAPVKSKNNAILERNVLVNAFRGSGGLGLWLAGCGVFRGNAKAKELLAC